MALAAKAVQARDDDDDEADSRGHGFCTATAQLLFKACGFEARDDLYIAKGHCINVGDAVEPARCLREAKEARSEAGKFCGEQLEWRRGGLQRARRAAL